MIYQNQHNVRKGLRCLVAFAGAITVTLVFCLLAPLLGGKGPGAVPEVIKPIQLTPFIQELNKVEKKIVEPRKIIHLPEPQKSPVKSVRKLDDIKIALQPLNLEVPQLEVATLSVPLPSPTMSAASGFGLGVHQLTDVDTPPKLRRYTPPQYPAKAKGQGVTGNVVVRCVVSANGTVQDAEIMEATPAGYFEKASLKTVKTWTFTPAVFNGENVACYVDIPLSFTLNN